MLQHLIYILKIKIQYNMVFSFIVDNTLIRNITVPIATERYNK